MRGNITRRSAGSFLIRFECDRVNGKRKQRCVTVRGSYKDAQRQLAKLLAAADAGTLADPSNLTVNEYVRQWLDNALGLSPKTMERYRELSDRQIIPHLGDVKISETPARTSRTVARGTIEGRVVGQDGRPRPQGPWRGSQEGRREWHAQP